MKFSKDRIIISLVFAATIFIVIFAGNSQPLSRVSLGVLFSTLIWYRSEHDISRWLALFVLWLGIFIPVLWAFLKS